MMMRHRDQLMTHHRMTQDVMTHHHVMTHIKATSARTILNTVWLRLLALFMRVSPTCRAASPVDSSSSTASGAVTTSSRSPATYTPASLLSWIWSFADSGESRSLMSSLYSCARESA